MINNKNIYTNIKLFLDDIKTIIVNDDTSITNDKVITTGQTIEKSALSKKEQMPFYTLQYDTRSVVNIANNIDRLTGELYISNVFNYDRLTDFKPVYDFISPVFLEIHDDIKRYLHEHNIKYQNNIIKTITKKEPVIFTFDIYTNVEIYLKK